MARRVEAREVAELGDDGDRDEKLDAAQGLQRVDDRIQPPGRRPLEQLGLEAMHPIHLLIDGADRFLKHDLLRRRGADDLREVASMGLIPVGPPDIVPPQPEQKRLQPELRVLECQPRRIAGPTEIAHRFIVDRRHVHARQIAERSKRASSIASRRSVLTLSPGFFGISEGATT